MFSVATRTRLSAPAPAMRGFSDEALTIPTDKEQQGGRRKEELDAAERGEIGFDHRSSLVPPDDAGTKENPIMVRAAICPRAILKSSFDIRREDLVLCA